MRYFLLLPAPGYTMVSAADFFQQDFDYIIIGGGTTGLALASILSTNAGIRVGVIEAGLRKDDEMTLVPGMVGKAVGSESGVVLQRQRTTVQAQTPNMTGIRSQNLNHLLRIGRYQSLEAKFLVAHQH